MVLLTQTHYPYTPRNSGIGGPTKLDHFFNWIYVLISIPIRIYNDLPLNSIQIHQKTP